MSGSINFDPGIVLSSYVGANRSDYSGLLTWEGMEVVTQNCVLGGFGGCTKSVGLEIGTKSPVVVVGSVGVSMVMIQKESQEEKVIISILKHMRKEVMTIQKRLWEKIGMIEM